MDDELKAPVVKAPTKKAPPKKPVAPKAPAAPKAKAVKGLASDDPKFPPIAVRAEVLDTVETKKLVAWAQTIDPKAGNREKAKTAILLSEFGEAALAAWLGK